MQLCCKDPAVQAFTLGVGIPAVVLFALGIPLSAALLLKCSQHKLEKPRVKATLGFLYTGYRSETYYWEAIVMLRKALVAAIAVFLAPMGASVQTYASLMLIFVLAMFQMAFRPFKAEVLNRLELGSLVSAFATFECGLFLTDPNTSDALRLAATIAVFVVNLSTIAAILAVVLASSDKVRRVAKQARALGWSKSEPTRPNLLSVSSDSKA